MRDMIAQVESATRRTEDKNNNTTTMSSSYLKENVSNFNANILRERTSGEGTKMKETSTRIPVRHLLLSPEVFLDSVAESKISGDTTPAMTIIEAVMSKSGRSEESKLAKALLANENESITTEEALEASVTDMKNLQHCLCNVERDRKELQEKNAALISDKIELHSKLVDAQNYAADLQKELDETRNQKLKVVANLKKKRDMLLETSETLEATTKKLASFQNEKGSLLQGIQNLSAVREELKNKLRCKNEIFREQRNQITDLEKRLRAMEQARAKEQQLLQLYRQLSLHTGYFKWGKQIRTLESELAAAAAAEEEE